MAIKGDPVARTTPFPTPIVLPPPNATTRFTWRCAARDWAAATASLGTCGATPSNSAISPAPSALRTRLATCEFVRLGVHIRRMRSPSTLASTPTLATAPRPKRTRGAWSAAVLLGERPALHHFQRIGLDFQEFAVRPLEVERVLHPIGPEVL